MERLAARTADGIELSLRRFAARGERRGALLCTHAMMANGGYMARGFAESLARAGIEVYVLDWRGHGDSVPPWPQRDDWCFDDYVELDLPAALAAVCERADIAVGQLTYLGHSLGGLVGLAAFGTGVAPMPGKLALFATSVWLPGPRGPRRRRWIMEGYRLSARLLGRAPIRRLRVGSDDETRGYVEQLADWAASGQWTSRTGVDYLAGLRAIDRPVWPVVGEGDRLCSVDDAAVLARRLPRAMPIRRVGRAYGDPIDADHFSLFKCDELVALRRELADFVGS